MAAVGGGVSSAPPAPFRTTTSSVLVSPLWTEWKDEIAISFSSIHLWILRVTLSMIKEDVLRTNTAPAPSYGK